MLIYVVIYVAIPPRWFETSGDAGDCEVASPVDGFNLDGLLCHGEIEEPIPQCTNILQAETPLGKLTHIPCLTLGSRGEYIYN